MSSQSSLLPDDYVETRGESPKMNILPTSIVEVYRTVRGGHNDGESSRSGFSRFPSEVSDLCYELFLRDCNEIFDPFAGWGERHYKALQYRKNYTGVDISPQAISQAGIDYGVENILGDSLKIKIPKFDGLITCPPYWNLETYTQNGIENEKTFGRFIDKLVVVFARCHQFCKEGGVFCVLVGNWRKKGVYYDLSYATKNMFYEFGCSLFDSVIISRKAKTKVKVLIPQAVKLGYTVNLHEELLVFKKERR